MSTLDLLNYQMLKGNTPLSIATTSPLALGAQLGAAGVTWASATVTANRAYLVPFVLPAPRLFSGIAVLNGAAVSGNIDGGVYDSTFTRKASSGTTAQAGIGATQTLSFTAITLFPAGQYFMAVALDNATGTLVFPTSSPTGIAADLAMFQGAAFVLPAGPLGTPAWGEKPPMLTLRY